MSYHEGADFDLRQRATVSFAKILSASEIASLSGRYLSLLNLDS